MINQKYDFIEPMIVRIAQYGQRLDRVISVLSPNYSRSQIKRWILSGQVIVNNQIIIFPKTKMRGGERIEIRDVINNTNYHMYPQDIPLDIVYEDNDIVVINKASNMVVHPGAGNHSGTILNALLYRYPSIIEVSRAGIVQRLDKDTTGLMIVAKHVFAYNNLLLLFRKKQIIRKYEAIVFGKFTCNKGIINQPIRRHTIHRTRMAVHSMGKIAITHYYVVETFFMHTRIRVRLETGRTHQIRVHMAYINHPLVGDQKYGKLDSFVKETSSDKLNNYLRDFNRQALHAYSLKLFHPITRIQMMWNIPLPKDILNLINILRENKKLF